jgi:hypothetical protein
LNQVDHVFNIQGCGRGFNPIQQFWDRQRRW